MKKISTTIIIGLCCIALTISVNAQNKKDKFVDTTVFKPEKCRDTTIRLYKPVAMLVLVNELKDLYQWKKGFLRKDTVITLGDSASKSYTIVGGSMTSMSYSGQMFINSDNAFTAKELATQKANIKANINYPYRFYYTDKKTLFRLEVLNYKFL